MSLLTVVRKCLQKQAAAPYYSPAERKNITDQAEATLAMSRARRGIPIPPADRAAVLAQRFKEIRQLSDVELKNRSNAIMQQMEQKYPQQMKQMAQAPQGAALIQGTNVIENVSPEQKALLETLYNKGRVLPAGTEKNRLLQIYRMAKIPGIPLQHVQALTRQMNRVPKAQAVAAVSSLDRRGPMRTM